MNNSPEFLIAVNIVNKLKTKPIIEELEILYGYYKQATIGNIDIDKPFFYNFKELQKWNAWNACKNLTQNDAEIKYILYVNNLIQKYGIV